MKQIFSIFIVILLAACSSSKTVSGGKSPYQSHIDATRNAYAPDGRTAIFQVEANGIILKGETNNAAAKAALFQRLESQKLPFTDSIEVLPSASLQGQHFAVVNVSVANLRTQPKHPAELATQATMGTPLKVLKSQRGWYLVQTPDDYIAWVDGGGITLMLHDDYTNWQQKTKLIYTKPFGFAYAKMDAEGATISDMVYGDVLAMDDRVGGYYKVIFPDGRQGFTLVGETQLLKDWKAQRDPNPANYVATAIRLMGLPYLWGGTSFKGVDCSGFTKTVYFMNGLVLPRDASQQARIGELVPTAGGWHHLQPGDLLFFGTPAKDGNPERVVHVGMWIGDQKFIHSSNRVRISSMDPSAPDFDEAELKRFLYAKRISPQSTLADLRQTPVY